MDCHQDWECLFGISWLQRQATTECGKFPGEDLKETASQPAPGAAETVLKGNPRGGVIKDAGNREGDLQPQF